MLPCRWIYYRLPLCLVVNADVRLVVFFVLLVFLVFKEVLNVSLIEEVR